VLADPGDPAGLVTSPLAIAEALAAAFAAEAPSVRVEVWAARPSVLRVAEGLLAGAPPPAAVLLAPPRVRDLPGVEALAHNLTPVMRRAGVGRDAYPSLLAYETVAGRLLAAPFARDVRVAYYNLDAFARAGLGPPGAWDWPTFLRVTEALARRRVVPYPLAAASRAFDPELFAAFVVGFGGSLEPWTGAAAPRIPSPAAAQGVRALLSLRAWEPPRPVPSPRRLFARGLAAIYFGHQADLPALAEEVGDAFAWDAAPLPRWPARPAVPVRAPGFAVVAGPTATPAAVAFALFGLTRAGQRALEGLGAVVPALRDLASDPTWRQAMRAAVAPVDPDVWVADPTADVVVPPALFRLDPRTVWPGPPLWEEVAPSEGTW